MHRLSILAFLALVASIVAVLLAACEIPVFWREFGSYLSILYTILGLGYTIYQVTLSEAAARAAEQAAKQARAESQRRLILFTTNSVHRLIGLVESDLNRSEWGKAAIRLDDLADQAAQLGNFVGDWSELVHGLREASSVCRALENYHARKPFREKWNRLLRDVKARLDAHLGPFQTD